MFGSFLFSPCSRSPKQDKKSGERSNRGKHGHSHKKSSSREKIKPRHGHMDLISSQKLLEEKMVEAAHYWNRQREEEEERLAEKAEKDGEDTSGDEEILDHVTEKELRKAVKKALAVVELSKAAAAAASHTKSGEAHPHHQAKPRHPPKSPH